MSKKDTRIYDKLDEFQNKLLDHERTDRVEHEQFSRELAEVGRNVQSLVERDIQDKSRLDHVESKVSSIKDTVTSIESQVEKNTSAREASEELRKEIRSRVLWVAVPIMMVVAASWTLMGEKKLVASFNQPQTQQQ